MSGVNLSVNHRVEFTSVDASRTVSVSKTRSASVGVNWSFGTGRKAALAMFVCFQGKFSRFLFDSNGRIFSALIDFGNCQFHLANAYAPDTVTGCKVFSKVYISNFCPLVAFLLVILMV